MQRPTITYKDKTYTVLFPDLLRPLTREEYEGLKEDIKKNGIRMPIICDQDYGIIDGINRMTIAAELGDVGYFDVMHYGNGDNCHTLEEQRQMALSLNLHRRHLDAKELQEARKLRVERVAEGRRQGKSQRQLAEEEGVSLPVIQDDLKKATDRGLSVEPGDGKVKGKDGKKRAVTRAAPKLEPAKEPEAEMPTELQPAEPAAVQEPSAEVPDALAFLQEHVHPEDLPLWAKLAAALERGGEVKRFIMTICRLNRDGLARVKMWARSEWGALTKEAKRAALNKLSCDIEPMIIEKTANGFAGSKPEPLLDAEPAAVVAADPEPPAAPEEAVPTLFDSLPETHAPVADDPAPPPDVVEKEKRARAFKVGEVVTATALTKAYDAYAKHVLPDDCLEEQEMTGKKGERRKYKILAPLPDRAEYRRLKDERYTRKAGRLIDNAFDDLQELGNELEWSVDNLPDSLQGSYQAEQKREVGEELVRLAEEKPDLPDGAADVLVLHYPSLHQFSRAKRASEIAASLRSAAEALTGRGFGDVADELEDVAGQLEQVEFPGMYG
jgi:hypothetical protein